MRHMLAFAASAMIAVSAPALAQTAGSPGAGWGRRRIERQQHPRQRPGFAVELQRQRLG